MLKLLKKNKGFTLIELMVVIVIIAILAAIAIPAFTGYLNDAKDASATSEARNVYTAAYLYVAENGNASFTDGELETICTNAGVVYNSSDIKIELVDGEIFVAYASASNSTVYITSSYAEVLTSPPTSWATDSWAIPTT